MNNDLNKNYYGANSDEIQAAYERIRELEQTLQHVVRKEALEQLERSLR